MKGSTKRFVTFFERGGGETDKKGVFIQIQNTIVSLKALVSVKCLNTCCVSTSFSCTLLIAVICKSTWSSHVIAVELTALCAVNILHSA